MAKRSVQSRVARLPKTKKSRISKMAMSGRSIVEIAERHKLDYGVVQAVLWEQGTLSLQGSKSLISRRLRSLRAATRQEDRATLVRDVQAQVDYIYYAAKRLQAQREKVRKSVS